MILKNLMVSKLLKSKISNNRVAPYLKHTHIHMAPGYQLAVHHDPQHNISARFSRSHASKKSRLHQIREQQIFIYQQM